MSWWEANDGEGEDNEYAHHPSEIVDTEWGIGIVLCLPYSEDGDYQDENEEVNPDYLVAIEQSLEAFLSEYPELDGQLRIVLDHDDGSEGELMVQQASTWDGDEIIIVAG